MRRHSLTGQYVVVVNIISCTTEKRGWCNSKTVLGRFQIQTRVGRHIGVIVAFASSLVGTYRPRKATRRSEIGMEPKSGCQVCSPNTPPPPTFPHRIGALMPAHAWNKTTRLFYSPLLILYCCPACSRPVRTVVVLPVRSCILR